MPVAQGGLDASGAVEGAAESRFANGLETVPNVLLARQQAVQAEFELVEFTAREREPQVTLAQSIGIPPTTPIQAIDFAALPLPSSLQDSFEHILDPAMD